METKLLTKARLKQALTSLPGGANLHQWCAFRRHFPQPEVYCCYTLYDWEVLWEDLLSPRLIVYVKYSWTHSRSHVFFRISDGAMAKDHSISFKFWTCFSVTWLHSMFSRDKLLTLTRIGIKLESQCNHSHTVWFCGTHRSLIDHITTRQMQSWLSVCESIKRWIEGDIESWLVIKRGWVKKGNVIYINMIKQSIHVDVQGLKDEKMSLDMTYECNKTGSMLRGNPRWTILFLFKRKVSTPVSVQIQLW